MSDGLYVTADEAAEMLGVNVTTIYAYVSRKFIRSHKEAGTRASRYWRADVERIRDKLPRASARQAPEPLVSETGITVLTETGPYYRGRSVLELAETETLESVAALLWNVDQTVFEAPPPRTPAEVVQFWPAIRDLPPVDLAAVTFPIIERATPRAHDLSPPGFARTSVDVLRWFAALMVRTHEVTDEPLHKVVTRGAPDATALEDVVRRLLVLSADHELDPTTYAVRAAANTGVTPYKVAITGLVVSTGRRLSYGRFETLSRLLEEILGAADPGDAVVARIREGDALPGFGSRLYGDADPRAVALHQHINTALDGDADLKRLNAAIDVVREVTEQAPDFALLNLFVGRKLGLTGHASITLRLGRMAGWIAHAMEQYHEHELIRPRAVYTGPLPAETSAASRGRGARGRTRR